MPAIYAPSACVLDGDRGEDTHATVHGADHPISGHVLLVLAHDRRQIVLFNVTAHPTAEGTAQQLREAFPFELIPRYPSRDRDPIFGASFGRM